MNIILLSGGSGKRLWPLSNDTMSKQFLKLLKNDNGEFESMVQRVMRQIRTAHPDASIFISSNTSQLDALNRQLNDVEVIQEPSRRNTFPAIALAAAYLRYVKQLDESETFIVCPIDAYAELTYFQLLSEVEKLVTSKGKKIGLLGVFPTYPSEQYGYIIQDKGEVSGFVEKPSASKAESLISTGALWNCGVFSLEIGYVLSYARKYAEFESFESLYQQYDKLPQISIDYEIAEKEKSIGVVKYNGIWKDLGAWNSLTEEMSDNSIGRDILISDDSNNTHVLNMLNIPIMVQDLSDSVIIASHDGILVSSKEGSTSIKPLAEKINLRPMYEQRKWGKYRVLDYLQSDGASSLIKRLHIDAGKSISYQYHSKRSEVWVIVKGKGILTLDGVESEVSQGSVIHIPCGAKHSLRAETGLEFVEVQLGAGELEEEDIVRISAL